MASLIEAIMKSKLSSIWPGGFKAGDLVYYRKEYKAEILVSNLPAPAGLVPILILNYQPRKIFLVPTKDLSKKM